MHRVQQGGHLHLAARQHFGSVRLKSTSRLCKQLGRIHEPRAPPCGVTAVRQRARRTTVNIDVSPVTSINRRIRSPPSDVVYCSWRAGEISSSTKLKAINRNELNDFKAVYNLKIQLKVLHTSRQNLETWRTQRQERLFSLWYNNYVEFTVTYIMLLSGWKKRPAETSDWNWRRLLDEMWHVFKKQKQVQWPTIQHEELPWPGFENLKTCHWLCYFKAQQHKFSRVSSRCIEWNRRDVMMDRIWFER